MRKNHFIVIAIIIILILGGIVYFSFLLKEKAKFEGKSFKTGEGIIEEIFSLSGVVLSADGANNFLMVKPSGKEGEIKVILSETTKLIKLETPFSPENPPPPGTQFTPEQAEITLKDFKEGDEIFIKTTQNIAGKTEFDDVEFIQKIGRASCRERV